MKPVPSPEDDSSCAAVEGYLIPAKIRKSRENMRVDRFQYDRPYHRGTKSAHNEFKTLWIERTLFQCASGAFPGILRWVNRREVFRFAQTDLRGWKSHFNGFIGFY